MGDVGVNRDVPVAVGVVAAALERRERCGSDAGAMREQCGSDVRATAERVVAMFRAVAVVKGRKQHGSGGGKSCSGDSSSSGTVRCSGDQGGSVKR